MTWHILLCLLHWLWCLGSEFLIRRPVLSAIVDAGQDKSGWGRNLALEWCPQRCPWRAGSSLQVASWALPSAPPPRKLRVYEREGENVLFFTSLPRPVSSRKTSYIPPSVTSRRLITVGKRNSATDICVGGRFGDERVCIGVAMLSTCISFLLPAFTFM